MAEYYDVVAVDPPGTGKSDKPHAPVSTCRVVERLVAFMDAKGIACPPDGRLAGRPVRADDRHGSSYRAGKLVLMGSAERGRYGPLLDLGIRLFWFDALGRGSCPPQLPTIFHASWAATGRWFGRSLSIRWRSWQWVCVCRPGSGRVAHAHSIFYTHLRPRMHEVHQPVLLVWGEHDRIHLPSEARYFARHTCRTMAGHLPHTAHEVVLDEPGLL